MLPYQWKELLRARIIGYMIHPKELLTQKEQYAQIEFMKKITIPPHKTRKLVVIAMVGLVGSGKSTVAQRLAEIIGATVLESDIIRVELRKQEERYEGARKIGENVMRQILDRGGNVIMDSDHIEQNKRASLREKVRRSGAKLIFIRTYANYDMMAGQAIAETYKNKPEDFFGGASTVWKGSEQTQGAVVKLREMWRRTPHHYYWDKKGGGRWTLRTLPFPIFATIYTGWQHPENIARSDNDIREVAQRICNL